MLRLTHYLVRSFQRFLAGDNEYKDLRLKILPSVLDGPLPIRYMAPPKQELIINSSALATTWRQVDGTTGPGGTYLHPCLEVEVDLVSDRVVRGMSNLVKRYLQGIVVDVALAIGKPALQKEDELGACLGLWKYEKVDLSSCPKMPERLNLMSPVRADTIRASMLMQKGLINLGDLDEDVRKSVTVAA